MLDRVSNKLVFAIKQRGTQCNVSRRYTLLKSYKLCQMEDIKGTCEMEFRCKNEREAVC
jgi:hypothetical protein